MPVLRLLHSFLQQNMVIITFAWCPIPQHTCRFFDVTSGAILIDGQDMRAITQSSLRRAIGMVPQVIGMWGGGG
jgi:hypothetical protein